MGWLFGKTRKNTVADQMARQRANTYRANVIRSNLGSLHPSERQRFEKIAYVIECGQHPMLSKIERAKILEMLRRDGQRVLIKGLSPAIFNRR